VKVMAEVLGRQAGRERRAEGRERVPVTVAATLRKPEEEEEEGKKTLKEEGTSWAVQRTASLRGRA
jgi:hypothetical protein